MTYRIVPTKAFSREFKRLKKKYPSLVSDLDKVGESLVKAPTLGDPVYKNCYKVRGPISSMGKGKSGSARLITYVVVSDSKIYLLSLFVKGEKDTISDKQIRQLLAELDG